jgi:hypothetical protein
MLKPYALPTGVVIAAVFLYLRTLAPGTVYLQDTAEFQTKLYNLEIIHATGYPLYQIVGKLWTMLLPIGTIAWRVNLLSAFFSTICLVCLCCIMQQIGVRPWAIVAACGMLACSPLFWSHAILASAYPMHIALAALSGLMLLRWQDGRSSPTWFALACGAGLAHHRVFVILLPVFALVVLLEKKRLPREPRRWLLLGLLVIAPILISWIWLALLGLWPPDRLYHFLFVEGSGFFRSPSSLAALVARIRDRVWPWLIEPYGLFPTLVALGVLLAQVRQSARAARRRTGLLLLGMGLAIFIFSSVAWVWPDNRRSFAQWDLALAAGWGLAWNKAWSLVKGRLHRRWLAWTLQAVLAAAVLAPLAWLYPANLASLARLRDGYADRVSREILSTVESGATVFGNWVLGWPLRYYHSVEGLRPDVQVVVEPGDDHRAEAIALVDAGDPVYFRQPMYGLDWRTSGYAWAPLDVGNLARALPAIPPLAHVEDVDQEFEKGVTLHSFGFSAWPLRPDTFVRLWLDWEGTRTLAPETDVRLRLDDATGTAQWRYDTTWKKLVDGERSQSDVYWVTPPTLAPGDYTLHVALYEPDTAKSLGEIRTGPIPVTAGHALRGERLVLENQFRLPLQVSPDAPDLYLLGYSFLDQELWVGHLIPLSLFWQVNRVPEVPYTVSLTVKGREERHELGPDCSLPLSYPGALVKSDCVLKVPGGVADGRYLLIATVDTGRERWNAPLKEIQVHDRPHTRRVPRMQYKFAAPLGDRITLLGYDLSSLIVQPGQDLMVTLYWRAESHGNDWFKVFTHLVGPDGAVVAQHDSPPAEGAAPTSQWLAREVVTDQHTISIPADASGGECTLYVGMYSPDTGERLLALDVDGNPYPNNAIPLRTISIVAGESTP